MCSVDENIPRKKFCILHGHGSHPSDECDELARMVKKRKDDSDGKSTYKKRTGSNKTWKRKAEEATDKGKKDLAAFVKQAVAKGIQKELADKKRKAAKLEEGELDMNAVELDLKGFNYEDMDNLKIDSDDSDVEGISV